MELNFRKLYASELEVRIGNISKTGSGLSLLLYKDARVDQRLLDETAGPLMQLGDLDSHLYTKLCIKV